MQPFAQAPCAEHQQREEKEDVLEETAVLCQ